MFEVSVDVKPGQDVAAVSAALDAKVFTADLAAPGEAVATAQAAQAVIERLR